MILDERSAGFFALGTALATGVPAAVLCTSGSAASNLHPAVVEADEAGVPLIVLTADRPPELRDIGAGQTIDQLKLYGEAVRWFCEVGTHEADDDGLLHFRSVACRAYASAIGDPRPGPVHLNVPWREPLAPVAVEGQVTAGDPLALEGRGDAPLHAVTRAVPRAEEAELDRLAERIESSARGLIVAGRQTDTALAWSRRRAGDRRGLSDPGRAHLAAAAGPSRPLPARHGLRRDRAGPPIESRARVGHSLRRPPHQQAAAPMARGDRRPRPDRHRPGGRMARADPPRRHAPARGSWVNRACPQ